MNPSSKDQIILRKHQNITQEVVASTAKDISSITAQMGCIQVATEQQVRESAASTVALQNSAEGRRESRREHSGVRGTL